jgi:cell division septation protein DedD
MKRKTLLGLTAVVLVVLALYGVWHYSPLRYLTGSKSNPVQAVSGNITGRRQPIVITKKIAPQNEATPQTSDLPRALVVLKKFAPQEKSQPVKQQLKSTEPSAAPEKHSQVASSDSLSAKASVTQTVEPEKASKPLPPEKTAGSVKPESLHPYSIMLSSCRLPQSAHKIVSDYQKTGLTPYIVKVKFDNGDEWLRVLTGHYRTRREALKIKKEQQLSKAIVKKTPYTNLIGTFAAKEAMQKDLSRLSKLGYSPYFLKTQNGRYKLLVGAFVTLEGAQNQKKELLAKGIQNRVIKR